MALSEAEKRKPEFVAGSPAVLADGQTWWFPPPPWRVYATFEGGRATSARVREDPELLDLRERYGAATGWQGWLLLLSMAAWLLGRNYTLSDADLGELLGDIEAPGSVWPQAVVDLVYWVDADGSQTAVVAADPVPSVGD